MKSFIEFITEAKRNRQRATKLLNRVYQRNRFNKIDNPLRKGYSDDMVSTVPWSEIHTDQFRKGGERINIKHFLSQPLQRVPIEHIVSNQERVSRSVISRKIHGKWKEHTPDEPHLIHHNGKYHVDDGNHQVNRDRFRGKKFVLARVVHADEVKEE